MERGSDLTLDLYTLQAGMVMFQNMDNAEWNVLWQRSGSGEDLRQQVEERNRKLVVRNVTAADEGVYKVMDAEGLALSTVKVSVKGKAHGSEYIISPNVQEHHQNPLITLLYYLITFTIT